MSDFKRIVLTFDLEKPHRSKVEIDGRLATNVVAAKVEQRSPRDQATIELEGFFTEGPIATPVPPRLVWRQLCVHCRCPVGEVEL